MAIQVGDTVPDVTLRKLGEKGPESVSTSELFAGKKVVLFAVPGAFTPTCSNAHLPGFVACLSVNDAFVMGAWGDSQNAEHILMLADGSADLTKALGVELDLREAGLGVRSDRFVMVIEDGKVTHFAREQPKEFKVSSAEAVLAVL